MAAATEAWPTLQEQLQAAAKWLEMMPFEAEEQRKKELLEEHRRHDLELQRLRRQQADLEAPEPVQPFSGALEVLFLAFHHEKHGRRAGHRRVDPLQDRPCVLAKTLGVLSLGLAEVMLKRMHYAPRRVKGSL